MNTVPFEQFLFQGLTFLHKGKVRDTYGIPKYPDKLLVIASDRISTHNLMHQSEIPLKGQVLNALTVYWMTTKLKNLRNHLLAHSREIYDYLPKDEYPEDLHLRAVIVKKLDMFPVKFIYRKHMAGGLWKSYQAGEPNPYGLDLPEDLDLMSGFSGAIFTPTQKSRNNPPLNAHTTTNLYVKAAALAQKAYGIIYETMLEKGIAVVDSKFEVGHDGHGNIFLADECGTPDCSRFVEVDKIQIGENPPWLDKQFLRDEAEKRWAVNKQPLIFNPQICKRTMDIYLSLFHKITGLSLRKFQQAHMS